MARRPNLIDTGAGRVAAGSIVVCLGYAAVMAWVGVVALGLRGEASRAAPFSPIGWLVTAVLLVALWHWRFSVMGRLRAVVAVIERAPEGLWLACWVAIGLVLRLAWIACFPSQPSSDGSTYLALAQDLREGHAYAVGDTRAYWPPGYPFFLLPWLEATPTARTAVVLSNMFLYMLGAWGVAALSRQLSSGRVSNLAVLLWCLWPNLIAMAGLPEKELLLVALLPWILRVALVAARDEVPSKYFRNSLVCGLLLGVANLVQPALLLFPAAVAIAWWWAAIGLQRTAVQLLVLALGMVLVIGPWSYRNARVLGHFVPISTNGGIGLYGANNERANGGYFDHWAGSDLVAMPEVQADKEARVRALAWIQSHPADFAALAYEKNLRFMGDDAAGVYQSLRRGQGSSNALVYAVFKSLANLFWCTYWAMIGLALLTGSARERWRLRTSCVLVPVAFIYSFALHSVVESAGKYHVLMIGALCVLLPWLVQGEDQPDE